MWNFLDILSFLSDDSQCDPALLFWLVEELLDSQTISGCRHIFDYLESRRERITVKNFKQKQLVILRSCNELLRRLSRAEDTAFCGRVFIFMFQCFPLGDRSSVNLRGEYHVENITSYEAASVDQASKMDVDTETTAPEGTDGKEDTNGTKSKEGEKRLTAEELYPLFWSLQESFSQPMRLFDSSNFAEFKSSLEATMKAFEALHADDQRGQKRKRNDENAENAAETFNPKYLTSSDLFELEVCLSEHQPHHDPANASTDKRSFVPTTRPRPSTNHNRLPPIPLSRSKTKARRPQRLQQIRHLRRPTQRRKRKPNLTTLTR